MHIPDVSEWNPNVDWSKVVATNGGAAIIRNLYGISYVDRLWAGGRRQAARTAGVQVLGIYQYVRASQDILAQAQAYVYQVKTLSKGEFAIADLEEGSGDQSGRASTWLRYVNDNLPAYAGYYGAWLYSGLCFAQDHGLAPIFDGTQTRTWVAAYSFAEPTLGHSLWQHSNGVAARCLYEPWPGIGYCDCSMFDGTLSDLKARVWDQGGTKPPAPPVHNAQEEAVNITRDDFARNDGFPIALPTSANYVRFFASRNAHIRVDLRDGSVPVELDLSYGSARNILVPTNGIVVHRDEPDDAGTGDVSYVINY